jgi:hypothetical protein
MCGINLISVMHNEKLPDPCRSSGIVRLVKSRWTGHLIRIGRQNKVTSGKIPLRRPRRRWKDYIKMVLREIGCGEGRRKGMPQNCVQ